MNNLKSIILSTIVLVTISVLAMAQGPGFDDDVEDTPIDGGVTMIAAAAIGYGVKKITGKRKSNEN